MFRKAKISNTTLAVLNPVAIGILIISISFGWIAQYSSTSTREFASKLYLLLAPYFPFSTIEAHARHSLYPIAVRTELLVLWLLCPILVLPGLQWDSC